MCKSKDKSNYPTLAEGRLGWGTRRFRMKGVGPLSGPAPFCGARRVMTGKARGDGVGIIGMK